MLTEITYRRSQALFLNGLAGKNRSAATVRAYQTDVQQFLSFLHENNVSIQSPADVEKVQIPPDLVVKTQAIDIVEVIV